MLGAPSSAQKTLCSSLLKVEASTYLNSLDKSKELA